MIDPRIFAPARVGKALRQLRLAKGLSLRKAIAGAWPMFTPSSHTSMLRFENGYQHITLDKLFPLLELYGISLEDFITILKGDDK